MSTPAQAPAVQVLLRRLDDELPVPSAARADDAGVDLHAREGLTLAPGQRALVPTGVAAYMEEHGLFCGGNHETE